MKKLVIIGLILMLAAASAFATQTRLLTLGENYTVLVDDYNQWMYPSRVNMYPNIGVGEFARYSESDNFYQFGVNWKFGEQKPWVLGTYFSDYGAMQPSAYYGEWVYQYGIYDYFGSSLDVPSNRRIDLLYGRKMGTTYFGLGFGYTNSGWKSEETGDKSEESFKHYSLTLGLTPDNGQWDVAAVFALGTWKDKNFEGKEESKPDGYNDIQLYGRYFHKINQSFTLVPHAGIWFGKHAQKTFFDQFGDTLTTAYSSKLTAFDLGAGLHYQPGTNVLAVLDFGIQLNKVTEEYTYRFAGATADSIWTFKATNTYLPYWKLGLEGDVFPWLDVRFGAVNNWYSWKFENDREGYDDYKYGGASTSTYLGFGFNWNRLHIDTYTDPELFLKGFDFISGSDGEGGMYMNWQLSVLYEMF